MARQPKQEKQPHLAWRITRTVLDVLGKIILVLLIAVGTVALIAAIAGSIFLSKFKSYVELDIIPKAEEYAEGLELDNISLAQTSIIYYTDPKTGEYRELQQLYGTENRIWVSYDDIPLDLVRAAISIEDKRFPTHKGVDWIRTLAAVKGFAGGSSSFGGSTITQQLIKNLSQEDEVTVDRKVQEIFRALEVEKRYTKSEIMEWYLNTIYLGEGCYGVQSAARVYFGKKVSDLTTAECASLIAITNNPSLYDPYIREENNRERQLTILKEMYAQGYIETEEAYQAAVDQEMVFRNGTYDEEEYTCASCGFTGTRAEYTETDGEYFCPQCGEVNNAVDKNHYYSYFVDTVWRDVVDALEFSCTVHILVETYEAAHTVVEFSFLVVDVEAVAYQEVNISVAVEVAGRDVEALGIIVGRSYGEYCFRNHGESAVAVVLIKAEVVLFQFAVVRQPVVAVGFAIENEVNETVVIVVDGGVVGIAVATKSMFCRFYMIFLNLLAIFLLKFAFRNRRRVFVLLPAVAAEVVIYALLLRPAPDTGKTAFAVKFAVELTAVDNVHTAAVVQVGCESIIAVCIGENTTFGESAFRFGESDLGVGC